MKKIVWDTKKARIIDENPNRGITFMQCVIAIESGDILANIENPSRDGQRIFVLNVNKYAYVVPYVEDEDKLVLKTVYPSRKYTKKFLR